MSEIKYYRPNNFPPVIKNLIIVNVLVFIGQLTLERTYQLTERLMLYPVLPPGLKPYLEAEGLESYQHFQPYQLITHLFSHAPNNIAHIIFNMFALWMFGKILENVWGAKRFLFFYLVCGIGAAAVHLTIQYFRAEQLLVALQQNNGAAVTKYAGALAPALGASGAIMGVLAAFAYLFPNTELYIMFIPIPVKAKWAVLGYAAIDLFGGISSINGDNIAHFAHLGGAITGFIIVFIWNKTNRKTLY
jgi:membrane associated rhomboid family serine protease